MTSSTSPRMAASADAGTLTRRAARRLHEIAGLDFPDQVRTKAAVCLLDYLGACIGGLSSPWAPAILQYSGNGGGASQSHQWGSDHRIRADDAAFANSVLGHSLIRDDMHVSSGSHLGVLIIPAALALVERDGLSGRALLRALVGGYEMSVRLGVAVRQGQSNQHFRPSGIHGAFGAASAAIAATGIEEDIAVHALGFAANAAAGVNEWPWAGGQEVYTHTGTAARGGLVAFDLACAGMRSSESVLEGRDGVFAAYGAGSAGAEHFERSLYDPLGILEVRHKPFAGCNLIQAPIAAALAARAGVADRVADIESITIKTFAQAQAYPGCDNTGPFSQVQQSKMSLQFGVASAVLYGRVDEDTYIQYTDFSLMGLIDRCRIEIDPSFGPSLAQGQQPARVEIQMTDGAVHSARVDDVPWLDDDAVVTRFRATASPLLHPGAVDTIIDVAYRLWETDDCTPLFEAFADTLAESSTADVASPTPALEEPQSTVVASDQQEKVRG
ncbi:MmgE/PrpD family protein [Rhodococcus sp. G-MC3]|uniref:MmgE/PrpD family protein n=1 Tax=Rhodococcus sp. G-MC3 TaxID=3046209 RepID=UPI0024B95AAC|nr:MmgE/PrpD family protein [Rhodococcus sp. G-MC3]MDJ0396577.1 MmgE/PrpD family protein [Rhodococcus sp. G-MC3]